MTWFTTGSVEERWVHITGREIAARFEAASRERFAIVIDDLLALPSDAPILAEGPQLLPDLVAPLLAETDQALFLVADGELQRSLIVGRGGASYERSSDPERALANRLERDRILSERLRAAAAEQGLTMREVHDPTRAPAIIEAQFRSVLDAWEAKTNHGDVSLRRRDENDARLLQVRLYAAEVAHAAEHEIAYACECDEPGCTQTLPLTLAHAESLRSAGRRLLAH